MTTTILVNIHCSLSDTRELKFGLRGLQRVCRASPAFGGWHEFDVTEGLDVFLQRLIETSSEQVLVILNPALIAAKSFLTCLEMVSNQFPERFIVASDPRSAHGDWKIDYPNRTGFERYVARRLALMPFAEADRFSPWAFMARKHVVLELISQPAIRNWDDVADAIRKDAKVSQHAFVHSYADYSSNDRREMLDLFPDDVQELADVGGGDGWFLSAFQAERPLSRCLLIEPSSASAALAAARGLEVSNTRFESVTSASCRPLDCISFLDVLEHLEDPLHALIHARALLRPQGYVVLSVPNVGHWSVVEDLMEGRFDYLPVGILCCTHLRFFTELSLRELLADAGLEVLTWRNQHSPMPKRFRETLQAAQAQFPALNWSSLETDSFHVVAQVYAPGPTGVQ